MTDGPLPEPPASAAPTRVLLVVGAVWAAIMAVVLWGSTICFFEPSCPVEAVGQLAGVNGLLVIVLVMLALAGAAVIDVALALGGAIVGTAGLLAARSLVTDIAVQRGDPYGYALGAVDSVWGALLGTAVVGLLVLAYGLEGRHRLAKPIGRRPIGFVAVLAVAAGAIWGAVDGSGMRATSEQRSVRAGDYVVVLPRGWNHGGSYHTGIFGLGGTFSLPSDTNWFDEQGLSYFLPEHRQMSLYVGPTTTIDLSAALAAFVEPGRRGDFGPPTTEQATTLAGLPALRRTFTTQPQPTAASGANDDPRFLLDADGADVSVAQVATIDRGQLYVLSMYRVGPLTAADKALFELFLGTFARSR